MFTSGVRVSGRAGAGAAAKRESRQTKTVRVRLPARLRLIIRSVLSHDEKQCDKRHFNHPSSRFSFGADSIELGLGRHYSIVNRRWNIMGAARGPPYPAIVLSYSHKSRMIWDGSRSPASRLTATATVRPISRQSRTRGTRSQGDRGGWHTVLAPNHFRQGRCNLQRQFPSLAGRQSQRLQQNSQIETDVNYFAVAGSSGRRFSGVLGTWSIS